MTPQSFFHAKTPDNPANRPFVRPEMRHWRELRRPAKVVRIHVTAAMVAGLRPQVCQK
jgi:hypothetical protein